MKEGPAFENCLEREVQSASPILYALLNASFLPVISFDEQGPDKINLYRNNMLIPYSELLMLSRHEIYTDAKIKLPFWYSLPLIPWLIMLFTGKKKSRPKKTVNKVAHTTATEIVQKQRKAEDLAKVRERNFRDGEDPKVARKKELRNAAVAIEGELVPESSSLERELNIYRKTWNNRIGKENNQNLTDDVNSLVRDYMRKVLKTLKSESFTKDRVESLAESLVNTPSLMKIHEHGALKMYIELYIVKLIKNLP